MARKSIDSLSNSLKGKIWLSTVALAFFVCTFGTLSYIVVSFLVKDPFYAIFIPFLLLAITIVAFGLWLSSEVVGPVERVLLLARSLERGISTSLPKTSGSIETNELLETIHRISGQVQRLVTSLDNVAQDNFDAAMMQNSNSDRISQSFQKLLTKVSESIHAKQDLDKLQSAIRQLSEESSSIKNGRLNVTVSANSNSTAEIAQTINYLLEQLGELTAQVKTYSSKSQNAAFDIEKSLRNVIQRDEFRLQEINEATLTLKKVPQIVHRISDEISQSALSANQSIEKARHGITNARVNFDAMTQLRRQVQESAKRMQKLNECSREIETAAKTVGDLAQRTNLVALNASVQVAELGEHGRKFLVISEEIERLATRADKTNKQINALNKAIQSEIEKVESSLENVVSEAANFSKFTIETGNLNTDMERYLLSYLHLQQKVAEYTAAQTADTEEAFQTLSTAVDEIPRRTKNLKDSVQIVGGIAHSLDNLQSIANHFNFVAPTLKAKTQPIENVETLQNKAENLEGETFI
jgi:methyl-accepting chemotaxis protein